jgi:RHS repeat-associated protein
MHLRSASLMKCVLALWVTLILSAPCFSAAPQVAVPSEDVALSSLITLPGQTATILPDGSVLVLGGVGKSGAVATAAIWDRVDGSLVPLENGLTYPRAWHSASVLPDGTVLIVGGEDGRHHVIGEVEVFDPAALTFSVVASDLTPRSHHAATLLTNGSLLIAGGSGSNGAALTTAQLLDPRAGTVTSIQNAYPVGRLDDHAALLPDGTALFWGGTDPEGNLLDYAEQYDPQLDHFSGIGTTQTSGPDLTLPFVTGSVPQDGATGVPLNVIVGIRFSKVLRPYTISSQTVTLESPAGSVAAQIVAAEGGRLAFVTPKSPLLPGTQYSVTLQGPSDTRGLPLPYKVLAFITAGEAPAPPPSSTQQDSNPTLQPQTPITAPPGVTAVSGQTLKLDGRPLANVTLKIGNQTVRSDARGRFLLTNPAVGFQTLIIDGRTANLKTHTYGVFEVGVQIKQGQTLRLPYVIWMTELDMIHAVHLQFPTAAEVVITTPTLPGLEFHLPPNTTITDIDGKVANLISITPVPITQPPFPLPHVEVPIYFTIQPGGGKIWVNNPEGPQGGTLFYPNSHHQSPGTLVNFWNYDPHSPRGWYIYGQGKVSANGQTIVPNPGVEVYQLTGAMVGGSGWGPPGGLPSGCPGSAGCSPLPGDPVDPSTGLFMYQKTDLFLPDTVPIGVTRVYRQDDTMVRAFGVGMSMTYDMWIEGNLNDFGYIELVQANGSRYQFSRTQGNFWDNSTLVCSSCPGAFYGAVFYDATPGLSIPSFWEVLLRDGTLLSFLQPGNWGQPDYQGSGLVSVVDRNGNAVQIIRSGAGSSSGTNYITNIISPNGRSIQFTYGNSNCPSCITAAEDSSGRVVQYFYNSQNQLYQVIDANQQTWGYGWNGSTVDQMTSLTDPRQIQFLTNYYDSNDRVYLQVQGDGSQYKFSYGTDAYNNITQTSITDPNNNVRVVNMGAPQIFSDGYYTPGGYTSTDTLASGTAVQETTTYQRDPNTGLLQNVTDALNRETSFTYDPLGNTASITYLTGTPSAVTTNFTYDPVYSRVTSMTDPLQHQYTFGYDGKGNKVSATDPLGNTTTFTNDGSGRLLSVTDPLGNTQRFGYTGADLTSMTDPLGNVFGMVTDGAGRVVTTIDPLGLTTKYVYNPLNQLTQRTDALGGVTSLTWDGDGNLKTVTDPRNTQNPTQYFYDNVNRIQTVTDPLGASTSYGYDGNGNLTCYTDRRGVIAVTTFDGVNRPTVVGYGASSCTATTFQSSTQYSYDAGNRPTGIVDSISGTLTPIFDGLDREISETTPQGSVTYHYDAAGRKTQMTVAGQTSVTYNYDNANRQIQITQGSANVTIGYDLDNRRTSLTLPNNVSVAYAYDNDSRPISVTYQGAAATLGNLTLSYDGNGRMVAMGGAFARSGLPTAVASASYDVANRLTAWGSNSSYTYDGNGNLQSDGTNTYSWDARNHLSSISGGVTASFVYDPFGRRTSKTIGSAATGYLYDGYDPVQELSGTIPTANLLNGDIDEVFTRTDTSTMAFLRDGLSSTVGLVNASSVVGTGYTYDPYGNTTTSGTANANSYEYTGRENDGTGLYFNRARYYSPALQRFISQDPIGFDGGQMNLYGYAGDDPIDGNDPMGTSLSDVHWLETYNAARAVGYTVSDAWSLADQVAAIDFQDGTQDAGAANQHAMAIDLGGRKPKQTICQAFSGTANIVANGDLAQALHAIQDSYSASHQYSPWNGGKYGIHWPGWAHVYDDLWYHDEAEAASEAYLRNPMAINPGAFLAPTKVLCP